MPITALTVTGTIAGNCLDAVPRWQLQPERLGVTVPPSLRAGDLLDVLVPNQGGVTGNSEKVRVRIPGRLGPGRSLEVDVWTARLDRAGRSE